VEAVAQSYRLSLVRSAVATGVAAQGFSVSGFLLRRSLHFPRRHSKLPCFRRS
jgi:hypothetical protein